MIYEVGDKITFTPSAIAVTYNGQESTIERNERSRVTGVVVAINRKHRWFRVQYKPKYDREQYECFKY